MSWSEVVNGSQNIYVKRWDSATSRWVLISTGALDNVLSQTAEKPSLVLNGANNPIVAWQESTTSQQRNIYVKGF